MTLFPSLRGGSSYTGAILPPRPPRLGAAGFTDPVGPGFIKSNKKWAQPKQETGVEVFARRAHPVLRCPHHPSPLPQPLNPSHPDARAKVSKPGLRPLPLPIPLSFSAGPWGALALPECGLGVYIRGPESRVLPWGRVQGSWKIRNQL